MYRIAKYRSPGYRFCRYNVTLNFNLYSYINAAKQIIQLRQGLSITDRLSIGLLTI